MSSRDMDLAKFTMVANQIAQFQAVLEKSYSDYGVKFDGVINVIVAGFAERAIFANKLIPEVEDVSFSPKTKVGEVQA